MATRNTNLIWDRLIDDHERAQRILLKAHKLTAFTTVIDAYDAFQMTWVKLKAGDRGSSANIKNMEHAENYFNLAMKSEIDNFLTAAFTTKTDFFSYEGDLYFLDYSTGQPVARYKDDESAMVGSAALETHNIEEYIEQRSAEEWIEEFRLWLVAHPRPDPRLLKLLKAWTDPRFVALNNVPARARYLQMDITEYDSLSRKFQRRCVSFRSREGVGYE